MTAFFARVYSIYAAFWFIVTSIFFLLPQLIMAQRLSWHPLALRINYFWAWTWMTLLFMKVQIDWEARISKSESYVLCANHFSFMDIPVNYLLGISFKYIGKSSIAKAPVFGYMFRKIHVMVNRESMRSRGESMRRAQEAMQQGFNMFFFPEGGILAKEPPQMIPFRDGAFRLACEFNNPVLPIVLHDNYKVFPDDGKYLLFHHPIRITVGNPISPTGNTDDDVAELRQATHSWIQEKLNSHE